MERFPVHKRIGQRACKVVRRSYASTTRLLPSAAYTHPTNSPEASASSTPGDITKEQRNILDAALRVDQAGEVAANWIYIGQLAVLGRDRVVGPLIQVSMNVQLVQQRLYGNTYDR